MATSNLLVVHLPPALVGLCCALCSSLGWKAAAGLRCRCRCRHCLHLRCGCRHLMRLLQRRYGQNTGRCARVCAPLPITCVCLRYNCKIDKKQRRCRGGAHDVAGRVCGLSWVMSLPASRDLFLVSRHILGLNHKLWLLQECSRPCCVSMSIDRKGGRRVTTFCEPQREGSQNISQYAILLSGWVAGQQAQGSHTGPASPLVTAGGGARWRGEVAYMCYRCGSY